MARKKKTSWNYIQIVRNGKTLFLKYKDTITWTNTLGYPFPDASVENELKRVQRYFPDAEMVVLGREQCEQIKKNNPKVDKTQTVKGPMAWEQEEFADIWEKPNVRKTGARNRVNVQSQTEDYVHEDQPEGIIEAQEDEDILWQRYGVYAKCQKCIMNCKQHGGVVLYYCPQFDDGTKNKEKVEA